jgi:hypothetical protein
VQIYVYFNKSCLHHNQIPKYASIKKKTTTVGAETYTNAGTKNAYKERNKILIRIYKKQQLYKTLYTIRPFGHQKNRNADILTKAESIAKRMAYGGLDV